MKSGASGMKHVNSRKEENKWVSKTLHEVNRIRRDERDYILCSDTPNLGLDTKKPDISPNKILGLGINVRESIMV